LNEHHNKVSFIEIEFT